jgi:hypothetical protein
MGDGWVVRYFLSLCPPALLHTCSKLTHAHTHTHDPHFGRSLLASKFPHMLHMLCDSMGPKEACVQVCDALGVQASSPHRSAEPLDMAFSARYDSMSSRV